MAKAGAPKVRKRPFRRIDLSGLERSSQPRRNILAVLGSWKNQQTATRIIYDESDGGGDRESGDR
jgi:hypothetical protein